MTKNYFYQLATITFLFLFFSSNLNAQEAQIWKKYTGEISDSNIPDLPNYSYAGYKLGTAEIPTITGPIFDITHYGAIANDGLSDATAIRAAIAAAESAGGGVVFFPRGEFTVKTDAGDDQSIRITGSNIVLRGSGSEPGGTVINMKQVMAQEPTMTQMHQANPMFKFEPTYEGTVKMNITEDTDKGSNYITVDVPSRLWLSRSKIVPKFVRMEMAANKDANALYLDGKTSGLRKQWKDINEKGVTGKEFHEIDRIEGNKIYFKDAFINDIKAAHNWTVMGYHMMEESGFEDIHFKGNFNETFVHHKDYKHDVGWNALGFTNTAHCWLRRSRFSNVSYVAMLGHSYANSLIQILVDGKQGHGLMAAGGSSRILMGLIWDNGPNGQFHGVDVSGGTTGTVIWRIDATKGGGMDIHGSSPRSNLYDLYKGFDVTNNGGNSAKLPNHLGGLTLWNHSRVTGPARTNYDFWQDCGRNEYCNTAAVANPVVVGYHGSVRTTFKQASLKYEESNGTKVFPESLYEAQVAHRVGSRPVWMDAAISEYETLKIKWYTKATDEPTDPEPEAPIKANYTETINNLVLDNAWGKETYLGDHSFIWNVDGKGENDRFGTGKNIYFQKATTGITSLPIPGGIASFSVECKDLWDTGVERKIELLINGTVVGSMLHTGPETYTFSVDNINITGAITIAIRNASTGDGNLAIAIDNIYWTTLNPTASVEDYRFTDVKIYPNPSNSGLFNIHLKQAATAKVHDLQGRIVKSPAKLSNGNNSIDISQHNSGIYILTLTSDHGSTKTYKLIRK